MHNSNELLVELWRLPSKAVSWQKAKHFLQRCFCCGFLSFYFYSICFPTATREGSCVRAHTHIEPAHPALRTSAPMRKWTRRGTARMAAATGQRLQQRSARGHPSTPLLTSYWGRGRTFTLGDTMHYCRVEAKSSEWPIRSKYVDQSVATRGWSLMISVARVGGEKTENACGTRWRIFSNLTSSTHASKKVLTLSQLSSPNLWTLDGVVS